MDPTRCFAGAFKGRRVLVTGHTGFKGAWLCQVLHRLGAEVHGLALPPETEPSLYRLAGVGRLLASERMADLRDWPAMQAAVAAIRPQLVLHLAAQALVRRSYREPKATFDINVGGTVNLLEAVRLAGGVQAVVVVTSDKCYENREQLWGYREDDPLGGHDPYSASKGACEVVVGSWRRAFADAGTRIASARAGNVIGGGDWSEDRIVCDCVRAFAAGRPVVLRNPMARRPWQHVLEPVTGYLHLASRLLDADGAELAGAWNFGPEATAIRPVGELVALAAERWGGGAWRHEPTIGQPHEAGWLALSCDKALHRLGWRPTWDFDRAVTETMRWYRAWHDGSADPGALTGGQIAAFIAEAGDRGLPWAGPAHG